MTLDLQTFLSVLSGVVDVGNGKFKANCPIHEADGNSHDPSLHVTTGNTGKVKVIAHCFVCGSEMTLPRFVHAAGHTMSELFSRQQSTDIVADVARLKRMPLESFKAFGATAATRNRATVARVPMFNAKREQCSEFDLGIGNAGLAKGLSATGKPTGLFVAAWPKEGDTVLITEGPKDAAALHGLGYLAVGLPTKEMAKKFSQVFAGCHVIVVPDRDKGGEDGARVTAARLAGVAASVRIASLPAEFKQSHGDGVREVLAMRDGEALLRQAIADAKLWMPATNEAVAKPKEKPVTVRNFEGIEVETGEGTKTIRVPLPIITIANNTSELTGDWPRRVGSSLFIQNAGRDGVAWLSDTDALFGFYGEKTGFPPEFATSKDGRHFHSRGEFFSHLARNATEYTAVDVLPHEPPMKGHFYACEIPPSGDGSKLAELVGRFAAETDIDRDLILAAFATPFWGGHGGTRPAFCLTSDAGRGCGKSKLASFIADLAGGCVEISNNEDIGVVKTRLLSPDGAMKRVALLDNVKSFKFSWAELESLITAPTISGKRNYVGEGQRPNSLTFVITLNGVSLSTDLAQRCVIIKLKKPDFSGDWEESTRQFIDKHRREIVSDILAFLRAPVEELKRFSRWGDWEKNVLARLPEPSEAQAIIRERQAVADVENEESDLIEEFFAKKLEQLSYSKDDRVLIPVSVAVEWFAAASGEKMTTTRASRAIRQRIDEGQFKRLMDHVGKSAVGRCFEWWGEDATGEGKALNDIEHQIEIHKSRSHGTGNGGFY